MVYSTRRFVVCLSVCHFVLVFFSPFSTAITSRGEVRANLSAFRTFVRSVLVQICRFPLPLGVWKRAAVCDCGTSWTFLIPFLLILNLELRGEKFKTYQQPICRNTHDNYISQMA